MEREFICMECGTENNYEWREVSRKYEGADYSIELKVNIPYCKECGAPIDVDEVEEEISRRANQKIREARGIISIDEIRGILIKYNVSQKFLSRLLGWGEITLTRYISGGYTPNRENSERLKALANPYSFQKLLNSAPEELRKEPVFTRLQTRVCERIEEEEQGRGKIYKVINWFLEQATEENPLTHLALQKLLYFSQCWSKALYDKWLFPDDCEAWAHGAVYRSIYDEFKKFRYMPLPVVKKESTLSSEELDVLKCVKHYYFDIYNAKTLEKICHSEEPYKRARSGVGSGERCDNPIHKKDMEQYYKEIARHYGISDIDKSGISTYLYELLK